MSLAQKKSKLSQRVVREFALFCQKRVSLSMPFWRAPLACGFRCDTISSFGAMVGFSLLAYSLLAGSCEGRFFN